MLDDLRQVNERVIEVLHMNDKIQMHRFAVEFYLLLQDSDAKVVVVESAIEVWLMVESV